VAKIGFESGDLGLYGDLERTGTVVCYYQHGRDALAVVLETPGFQSCGERGLQTIEPSRWDQDFKPGFRLQAEMAVKAALGQPSEAPWLDDAIETMEIISRIFRR
jgi:hypothetical protein